MITISEIALNRITSLMMEKGIEPTTHYLRVGVEGGGCSGLSYIMDFDDTIQKTDDVVKTDTELKIIIDRKSLLYLAGTELTYSDGLNGKGFQWQNPNASRTCGCGESFSI
jgi:iron-sulfur cluster assembly protein